MISNSSKIFFAITFIFIIRDYGYNQQNEYSTIGEIPIPEGYARVSKNSNNFAVWIRNLPLKLPNSVVFDFWGNVFKNTNDTTVAAVIDWDIKGKRLEQCMDILVRFYAEYLWEKDCTAKLILPLPGKQSLKWTDWKFE